MLDQIVVSQMRTDVISAMLGEPRKPFDKVILCNELLLRRERITSLQRSFESLFKLLTSKELAYIERHDFKFEKAVIHAALLEMKSRKQDPSAWFIQTAEGRKGPMDFFALEVELPGADEHMFVWKQGWKEWHSLSSLAWLRKDYFFDQTIAHVARSTVRPAPGGAKDKNAPIGMLIAGILQLPGVVFWMIWTLVAPFIGFFSFTGPVLPMMFAIFMALISVPLGIGLITGSRWAAQIKMASSVITLTWFMSLILIDEYGMVLLLFAAYEAIMFILVATNFDWQPTNGYP